MQLEEVEAVLRSFQESRNLLTAIECSAWLRAAGFSTVERCELKGAPTGILIGTR